METGFAGPPYEDHMSMKSELQITCLNGNDLQLYLDETLHELYIDDGLHGICAILSFEQLTLIRDTLSNFLAARTRSAV